MNRAKTSETPSLFRLAMLLLASCLIAGCATGDQPFKIDNPFKRENPTNVAAKAALNAGVALYNDGEYTAAVKKLAGANEIWQADKAIQLEALKYMAFSYCVTSQPAACRLQFEKALKLDPSFDLEPGEKGHPLWAPVFARAKRQK